MEQREESLGVPASPSLSHPFGAEPVPVSGKAGIANAVQLELARGIAADAVFAAIGDNKHYDPENTAAFCKNMRDGAYDDHAEVRAALAALQGKMPIGKGLTRTVIIEDVSPAELAALFCAMEATEQAEVFAGIHAIAKGWPGAGWCMQSYAINEALSREGRDVIRTLAGHALPELFEENTHPVKVEG